MLLALAIAVSAATTAEMAAPPPWPPAMKLADAVKGTLKGVGTEPFWSIEIKSPVMTLTEPGADSDTVTEFRIEYTSELGADAHMWTSGPLTVTVSAGECSDGMSDTVYPYAVEVTVAGKEPHTLKGCAYRPWGQDIVAAMPLIDLCLKASSIQPPIVYAAATAPDAGFVMLAGSDTDPLQSCLVTGGKPVVASYPGENAQPPGTNAEIFVRGPGQNPGGECYEAPEVRDTAGNLLGWWLDPDGC